ncbi:MAG: M23 family metallopeptidase [Gammaproteobacteria bacterium]|nr:M23 family metallopeptidase [Gammaproteobacteria bacterium]
MRKSIGWIVLICGGIGLAFVGVHANTECDPDMECVVTTGKRPTCPDGATCTKEKPEQNGLDCYMQLVDDEEARITGVHGENRPTGTHNGLDLAAPNGTAVFAAKPGTVEQVVNDFEDNEYVEGHENGNLVRINYDDKTQGVYIHLKKLAEPIVKKGDRVDTGDKVGEINNTGRSRGNHLHYTQWNKERTGTDDPQVEHPNCG